MASSFWSYCSSYGNSIVDSATKPDKVTKAAKSLAKSASITCSKYGITSSHISTFISFYTSVVAPAPASTKNLF